MNKYIGINFGELILLGQSDGYIPSIYKKYRNYLVYSTRTNSFTTLEGGEGLEKLFNIYDINTANFGLYQVDFHGGKLKLINEIKELDIQYGKQRVSEFSYNIEIPGIKSLHAGKEIKSKLSDGFDYSNAKSSKSIMNNFNSIFKNLELKDGYFSENIFKGNINNGNSFDLSFSKTRGRYEISLKVNEISDDYKWIKEKITSDDIKENSVYAEIYASLNENKESIQGNINRELIKIKKYIISVREAVYNNEVLVKNKTIKSRIDAISNEIEKITIESFIFDSKEGAFLEKGIFSDFSFYQLDEHSKNAGISYIGRDKEEVMNLVSAKQCNILGRESVYFGKIEEEELLKGIIKGNKIHSKEIKFDIPYDILQTIGKESESVIKNLKEIKNRIHIQRDTKSTLNFQKLEVNNSEIENAYNTPEERTSAYTLALGILTSMSRQYEIVKALDIDSISLEEIRKELKKYKILSDTLSTNYSGEGGLIINKELLQAVIRYSLIQENISEYEEDFLKNFIYTGTANYLSEVDTSLTGRENTSLKTKISLKLDMIKVINPSDYTIEKLGATLENILGDFEKDISGFKISNEGGNGAYYTPQSFSSLLKPFTENMVFPSYVSIMDVSAGSGRMLNFLKGDNIKKIANDTNPIALKVLKYTQEFDIDKIIGLEDKQEIKKLLHRSKVIITEGSALSYVDHSVEVDFFLANPPYIKAEIGSKEREEKLRNNKVKNINSGKVNMVEMTYRGLANSLKMGGVGMLISSARGISKTEEKLRLDKDNYIVPLYRIGISGDPFIKEGVNLAEINISGEDIYTFHEGEIQRGSEFASFFVTIYTRLNKEDQEEFENTAPTILMDYSELDSFGEYVNNNLDTNELFKNYNSYFQVFKKIKVGELSKITGLNEEISLDISNQEFKEVFQNNAKIDEYIKKQYENEKRLRKVCLIKQNDTITLQIKEVLDGIRKVDSRLLPLMKETFKGYFHEEALKNIIKKELGCEFNGYSFSRNTDSKLKQIGNKIMLGDKDFTSIINFPYPFSINALNSLSFSFILEKYLTGNSSDVQVINRKLSEVKEIIDEYRALNKKKGDYVISSLKWVGGDEIEKFIKFIEENKIVLLASKKQEIDKLVVQSGITTIDKGDIKNYLYFLSDNEGIIDSRNEMRLLFKHGRIFPKGYKTKYEDTAFIDQTQQSIRVVQKLLINFGKAYNTDKFEKLVAKKHRNSIELLSDLGSLVIHEYEKNHIDYFTVAEPLKKSKSGIYKEFANISKYKEYKKFMKIETFLGEVKGIDSMIMSLSKEIDTEKSKFQKDMDFKVVYKEVCKKIKNRKATGYRQISGEIVGDAYLLYLGVDTKDYNLLDLKLGNIQELISEIKNSDLKKICEKNINGVEENFKGIKEIKDAYESFGISAYYGLGFESDKGFIREFKENISRIGDIEVDYFIVSGVVSLLRENISKGYTSVESTIGAKGILSKIISSSINKQSEIKETFELLNEEYFNNKISQEVDKSFISQNMLLDIYNPDIREKLLLEFKDRISYIDGVILYYQNLEIRVEKNGEENKALKDELLFAKYVTQNTNEYEKIFILHFLKEQKLLGISFDAFYTKYIENTQNINRVNLEMILEEKSAEFLKHGKKNAESIIASLGVKSNFTKLYTNIFLDIESDILRNNETHKIFTQDYQKFEVFLDNISPFEEKITRSRRYAELLEHAELLRKREPLLNDLINIEEIEVFISENNLSNLSDEEIVSLVNSNKILKKSIQDRIKAEIKTIQKELKNLDEYTKENTKKLLPTFVQSKSLYKFHKLVQKEKKTVKLLNQSEVGTGKTFTMPFYEAVLDEKFINKKDSFKIYITEANLVTNTSKSLIENGISPEDILEGKISSAVNLSDIISFVKKGGKNLILSSSSLHHFDNEVVKTLCVYLGKEVGNIYLYSDEATFLKNTESNSYSGFKFILEELKKTKNLKLQNYLSATPVNNDNGDFLYLLELFNKENCLSFIAKQKLSSSGRKRLYELLISLKDLSRGEKTSIINEKKSTYHFIPNIIFLLEYLRTKKENSLSNVDINSPIEVKSKFGGKETTIISLKEHYTELGVPILNISYEDFLNKDYRLNEPLSFNSKDGSLSFAFIELYKNISSINFDRNLNSIGLKGNNSQLYKTYYSLSPSLIESMIIENFIQIVERIAKFKRVSQCIDMTKRNSIYLLQDEMRSEGVNILNNLILELAYSSGLDMEIGTYSAKTRVKRGFKEIEETKSFETYSVERSVLEVFLRDEFKVDNQALGDNLFIQDLFMNIDSLTYIKYKEVLKNIIVLEEGKASDKVIKAESRKAKKYLESILSTISSMSGNKIPTSVSVCEFIDSIITSLNPSSNIISTVDETYLEVPETLQKKIRTIIIDQGTKNRKVWDIDTILNKSNGGAYSERSMIMQLLEDFNSPLGSLFIKNSINTIIVESKKRGIDIDITEEDKNDLCKLIISNGNTLSGTLESIATENSKAGVNSFITTSYVATVENLYRNMQKNTGKAYMITGKHTKNSKEKSKIIHDFDKLDGFGKTLIATGKSVEKGLSIFNSLKGYTTVGDENAGALTQRIGRFRTLMERQIQNLDEYKETIDSSDMKEVEKVLYKERIDTLKSNKKEFFVLSNKLSESMLQSSEQKNILLQKVNACSLFDGIIDFNDTYFGGEKSSFNIGSVLGGVRSVIEENKEEFYKYLESFNCKIDGKILRTEIIRNIDKNIKNNIKSIKSIEGIKIGKINCTPVLKLS